MGKYIGIDLGTTFSCMAYIEENGQPVIIPNSEGDNTTPSSVLFEDGTTVVGKEAKNQSIMEPENYEQFVKRHMGERDYIFATNSGEKYSSEAVSGIVLAKMKADAEKYLGDTVDGAVITVPAYFNEAQRMSTIDAGKMANLNVIGIINEPTAAALSFGISKGGDKQQTIMVYDLGGGTFDVTVMRFDKDNITVLGTAGDRKLGGYDFDNKIIEAVIAEAKEKGIDVSSDPVAKQDLQLKAEEAKKALSSKEKTNIMLNVGGRPFKYTLTRDGFVDMVEPLLFKAVGSMETACDEAGLEYSDLDKILLVGGSTKMPLVKDSIEEETGIIPSSEVHPDEAVAIGAAYHVLNALKNQQKNKQEDGKEDFTNAMNEYDIPEPVKQYSFTDVTSHGIGIICSTRNNQEINSVILPKNIQVPASCKNQYATTVAFQEKLYIQVTQGEEEDIRYVTVIGTAEIEIPPREKIVEIEVTISCDENSIIHVRVYDLDLQKDLGEMNIDRISNLSEEEIKENQQRISQLNISGE
ncbi:Hsp70 family protein [Hespellia stercorisuis]|uniref:Chaperone protein DnaK n=1 Tax=Hespellia stercorisuis DSM 15480 TaxID=1121950 RepID=A0A1M6WXS4_9FIRM|nr:Hsp70 family protein [Hespellia stercorisuis]SHK98562.1 molecular chaperone DnaK [Hespellia stercorisuis DSM 15480]